MVLELNEPISLESDELLDKTVLVASQEIFRFPWLNEDPDMPRIVSVSLSLTVIDSCITEHGSIAPSEDNIASRSRDDSLH